jgi:hypothetical protein
MALDTTLSVLNRLIAIHNRSLAMYLGYASPSWHRGDERARETLDQIVASQKATVDRIGEMILDLGGVVAGSGFPLAFSGYHDLSFDFLLTKLIDHQRRDISAIEDCVRALAMAPMARAVAEETLGAAKAHLEMLQEVRQPAAVG